jgi:hypothetical protein
LIFATEDQRNSSSSSSSSLPEEERESSSSLPEEGRELQVAYDFPNRQVCDILLNNDHPDFFYIASNQGWFHETLPTNAEQDAYGNVPAEGRVMLCFASCRLYNKPGCTGDELELNDELDQALEIQVNSVTVAEIVPMEKKNQPCMLLKHQQLDLDSGFSFPANGEGRYLIKARILPSVINATAKQKIVRISSIIIF